MDIEGGLQTPSDNNGGIDEGTTNNTNSNIELTFNAPEQIGLLVDGSGNTTRVTTSPVTVPPGSTLFVQTRNAWSWSLHIKAGPNSTDPTRHMNVSGGNEGDIVYLNSSNSTAYQTSGMPKPGYEFDKWVVSEGFGTITNATDRDNAYVTIEDAGVNGSHIVTATYKLIPTYQLTLVSDPNGTQAQYQPTPNNFESGSSWSLVNGASNNFVNNPAPGYEFDQWVLTEGDGTLSQSMYTFGNSNTTLTATFKAASSTPTGPVTIDLTPATPNVAGSNTAGWSGASTSSPYTLPGNVTITHELNLLTASGGNAIDVKEYYAEHAATSTLIGLTFQGTYELNDSASAVAVNIGGTVFYWNLSAHHAASNGINGYANRITLT